MSDTGEGRASFNTSIDVILPKRMKRSNTTRVSAKKFKLDFATGLRNSTRVGGKPTFSVSIVDESGSPDHANSIGWSLSNTIIDDFITRYKGVFKESVMRDESSQEIQAQLDKANYNKSKKLLLFIYEELSGSFLEVLSVRCGNYFVQQYLDYCTPRLRNEIAKEIISGIVSLSTTPSGSRTLQKLFDVVDDVKVKEQMVEALCENLETISLDMYGNYVIQKALEAFSDDSRIIDAILPLANSLFKNKFGCCIVQKQLEVYPPDANREIVGQIMDNLISLINDGFGYFIIQFMIEKELQIEQLMDFLLTDDLFELAKQKYSSNVLEKLILKVGSNPVYRERIFNKFVELVENSGDKHKVFLELLEHPYANYVVQAILKIAETDALKERLGDLIEENITNIYKLKCGMKLVKILKEKEFKFKKKKKRKKRAGANKKKAVNRIINPAGNRYYQRGRMRKPRKPLT